jgi:hypothetical protein
MTKSIELIPRVQRRPEGGYSLVYEVPGTKTSPRIDGDVSSRADAYVKDAPATLGGKDALRCAMYAVLLLDERLRNLESAHTKSLADAYRGVHLKNGDYSRSDLVTFDGSLWLALTDTRECPGQSADWKMIVKGAR